MTIKLAAILADAANVFKAIEGQGDVAGKLQDAEQALEAALPAVADAAANTALSFVPGGAAADSLADALLNMVIGRLFAKLSPAGKSTTAAAVQAAIPPS